MDKKWWTSRTLWTNGFMFAGAMILKFSGVDWLDAETQASAIILVNVILRVITKGGLTK